MKDRYTLRCDGFQPEDYGLFSIGSLDGVEAVEIASHLEQQCETCVREVRRNLSLWCVYGVALSPQVAEGRHRNWASIVSIPPLRRLQIVQRWGAMAAAILLASAITTWIVLMSNASVKRHLQARVTTLEQQAGQLTHERDEAIQQRTQAAAVKPPAAPAPTVVRGPNVSPAETALNRTLANTRDALEAARQSLSSSQGQVTQLETQLAQQQTELASLRTQQATLEAHANSSEQNAARSARAVQQLQAHVTQLESERTRLVNLLEVRQRQSQQNIRLVQDLASPGTRFIPLTGTESAPNAHGYAIITADNRVTFYQAGLPGLAPNRTYQIWLIRDRGTPVVSGGTFNPNGARQSEVALNPGNLTNNLTAIAVTSEPSGGSTLPTGQKLLIGTTRRS